MPLDLDGHVVKDQCMTIVITVFDREKREDCRSGPEAFIDSEIRKMRKKLVKVLKGRDAKGVDPRSQYMVTLREGLSSES
jgi:hypothetical protein